MKLKINFIKKFLGALCVLPVIALTVNADNTTYRSVYLMIGVFQEPVCALKESDHSNRVVGVAFIKDKNDWRPAYPNVLPIFLAGPLKWSLLYHAGLVESIQTLGINQKSEDKKSPVYETRVDRSNVIQRIQITNGTFYGWCGPRKYLPMATVLNGWGGSEHHWAAFTPNDDVKKLIYPVFKEKIGTIYQCIEAQTVKQQKPFDYQPDDLKVYQSYKSDNGQAILSVKVDPSKTKCSSQDHSDTGFQWFVFDKSMQYLGGQMELIDFGDYDSSGNEQFLFWHTSYNEDGYVLFYDNFTKVSKFYWGYD